MSMTIAKRSLQLLHSETAELVSLDLPDVQGHQTRQLQRILILPGSELLCRMNLADFYYLKFNNVSKLLNKPISFVHALLTAAVFAKASVTFDSAFKFDRQIGLVVKGAFYQLSLFAEVKPYHSSKGLKKGRHALYRLD